MESTAVFNVTTAAMIHFTTGNSTILYGERGIVDQFETIIFGVFLFTFFIVGGSLNLLLLITVSIRNQKSDVILIFIAAFCITDLTSAIISPFWWYRSTIGYEHYRLPNIMCKLVMMGITTSIMATSMLIFLLAIIRYNILKNPYARTRFTSARIKIGIVCIFIVAVIVGVFTGLGWSKSKTDGLTASESGYGDCKWDYNWIMMGRILSAVVYPILVFIPLIGVAILSVMMVVRWRKFSNADVLNTRQLSERQKREQSMIVQFLLIVFGFMLGYIPLIGNIIRKSFSAGKYVTFDERKMDHNISVGIYVIQRFAEMLNPVLYLIGSASLRKRVMHHLKAAIFRRTCANDDALSVTETSSLQDIPASIKLSRRKEKNNKESASGTSAPAQT